MPELVPVGDDVADQVGPVHPVGKLIDDIVALPGFDTAQVWFGRRVVDRRGPDTFAAISSGICGPSISSLEESCPIRGR